MTPLVALVATVTVALGGVLTPLPAVAQSLGITQMAVWPVGDEYVLDGDGWPIFLTADVQLHMALCMDGAPSGPVDVELRFHGDDGNSSSSRMGQFPLWDSGGQWCGAMSATVASALEAGVRYEVEAVVHDQGQDVGTVGVGWVTIAEPLGAPILLSPGSGASVDAERPVLSAVLETVMWQHVEVEFEVSGPGLPDVSGDASLTADGTASWQVPTDLGEGVYHWRVRARLQDERLVSAWSAKRSFTLTVPAVPVPVAPVDGAGVTGAPVLEARLSLGGRDQMRAIFQVVDAGSGSVVAEGPSEWIQADGVVTWAPPVDFERGEYRWRVRAASGAMLSDWSVEQRFVMAAAPGIPDLYYFRSLRAGAELRWFPSAASADSPVLQYTISAEPGGHAVTIPADGRNMYTATIDGLAGGATYTFSLTAENRWGTSLFARRSAWIAPPLALAPRNISVDLDDTSAVITWDPPADTGGQEVLGYRVTASSPTRSWDLGPEETSHTLTDLSYATYYSVSVRAITVHGVGDAASIAFVPFTVPGAPEDLTVRRDDSALDLSWSPPPFDGGSPVTAYQLSVMPGDLSFTVGDVTTFRIPGLTNDVEYTMTVAAINKAGIGSFSEPSTPTAPLSQWVDTDGDGLSDGDEVRLGTDPLVVDTDLDGVDDGEQVVTVDVEADGVSVTFVGDPATALSSGLNVIPPDMPGAVTAAATVPNVADLVDGGTGGEIALSDLTFTVPAWASSSDRMLEVFVWSEGAWAPVTAGVSVSGDGRTVTVVSPELGATYVVVDLDEWRANARVCDLAFSGEASLDVEVIIDARPGVIRSDPTSEGLGAARAVLETLSPGDTASIRFVRADVIHFSRSISIVGTIEHAEGSALPGASVQWAAELLDQERARWEYGSLFNDIDELDWMGEGFAEHAFGATFTDSDLVADPCRSTNIVIVTDGRLAPGDDVWWEGPNYVPFLERTEPAVHILDVGSGNVQWLHDVAQATGGSYTFVPTAQPVGSWDRAIVVPEPDPLEQYRDDDGDGLSNWVETVGVRSANSHGLGIRQVFTSDPHNPDTDGDGISDGDEAGRRVTLSEIGAWNSDRLITTYQVVSDPMYQDSDLDGLSDVDETELALAPLNPDIDRDGLFDGDEAEWGTDIFDPDTDKDGWTDGIEVHLVDTGLDPLEPNYPIEEETWAQEFTLGALCGDAEVCRRDSVAWLTGNIASGILVYGDLRDLVHHSREGIGWDTALIAVGFVPAIGDAAGAAAKISRAIPGLAGTEARSAWRMLSGVGDGARYLEEARRVNPRLVALLEASVTKSDDLVRLLISNDPVHIERALLSPVRVSPLRYELPESLRFYRSGYAAEDDLRDGLRRAHGAVDRTPLSVVTESGVRCTRCRVPDAHVIIGGVSTLHESKVGYVRGWFAKRQFTRDIAAAAEGQVDAIIWHFYPSGNTGKVGPSSYLLTWMEEQASTAGVNFEIILHIGD